MSCSFIEGDFGRFGKGWRTGWEKSSEKHGDDHWGEDLQGYLTKIVPRGRYMLFL